MRIEEFESENDVFLAPMLAVNCPSFLKLCKKYGAGLLYTQFIDIDDFDINKYNYIFNIRPIAVQIIGSNKEKLLNVMKQLDGKVDVIDINLGCPLKEQLAKKSGVYFMKHPEMILKTFKDILPQIKTPVTAKIRGGWDKESINAPEVCKILEEVGFKAIAVHARTGKEGYTGKNDWELIKKCKESVNIPVIGSGDIAKPGHAKYYLERGYCDAVMIGRQAQKDPYVIARAVALLKDGKNISEKSKKEQFLDFFELYSEDDKNMKLNELKDHAIWFASDLINSNELKKKIIAANSFQKIVDIFNAI
jgi:tRNA-dihydrouridine synthase B